MQRQNETSPLHEARVNHLDCTTRFCQWEDVLHQWEQNILQQDGFNSGRCGFIRYLSLTQTQEYEKKKNFNTQE